MTIKTKSTVVLAAISTAVFLLGAQHSRAGVFDNLASVANGALASYGREATQMERASLSSDEIDAGLRQALIVGCANIVDRLHSDAENVRVELPGWLRKAKKIATKIGYGQDFVELEEKLNQAAIEVAPATRDILTELVAKIDIDDPRAILDGTNVAATRYLRRHVGDRAANQLLPIIVDALSNVGALENSTQIASHVRHKPRIADLQNDLADHVVAQSLDVFFHDLAIEEREIRMSPDKRSTELLRKVFG